MNHFVFRFTGCVLFFLASLRLHAQAVNVQQHVTLAGLRSANGQGGFPSAAYAADGSLYLLYDQKDGVRVLKLNAAGDTVVAQAQLGAAGDAGVSMTLDPAGNVYVAGTSTSGALSGTNGSAFPARANLSTNSFLAKFDANLNNLFVTFLGAGQTAVVGVAATATGVFVTGLTFSASLPVTSGAVQQTPSANSFENGFVERFSTDGSTMMYATYLTGANGGTAPSGIVADAAGDAFVAGYTAAKGYPTVSALVPEMLGESSGFLTRLTPSGDSFAFSTFVPGGGVTGIALDTVNQVLLLTGNVALGQFPIATVGAPLASTGYQSLLRIPVDGQSVANSILLVPGSTSQVSAGPGGSAWVTGAISTPLFPGSSQPLSSLGDSFALRVSSSGSIDQTLRYGGQPAGLFGSTSLTTYSGAAAVSADGLTVALPATLSIVLDPAVAATQKFDLGFVQAPNAALPSTVRDVAGTCTGANQCYLQAGYLTLVSTAQSAPALSLSEDDPSNVMVRNLGSASANGLALTASASMLTTNCGVSLAASNACAVALAAGPAQTLAISAMNSAAYSVPVAANARSAGLSVDPTELDFGLQSSASASTARTFSITNLGSSAQSFTSALDNTARSLPFSVSETASDCSTAANGAKILSQGASCHVTLALTASTNPSNDGPVHAAWKVAGRDVLLTGFTQAAALNLSATEIDFGTQFVNGLRLPRFLYVSNASSKAMAHLAVTLPAAGPFSVLDECASTLLPFSVCRLTLNYVSTVSPAADSITLTLDQGLSVLVTGKTLPLAGVTGSSANAALSATPASVTFAAPVVVTGLSAAAQSVTISNSGHSPIALSASVAGDFTIQNGCGTLAAGASCQILLSFRPSQPGLRQGLLSIGGGSALAPLLIPLAGTAIGLLPANNGTLDLGLSLVGEPKVAWYKVQQSLATLSVQSSSAAFAVAIVEDSGYGHGTLPPGSFASAVTTACSNCYIGIQFLSPTAGLQGGTLTLATLAGGNAYTLALTATALPVTGLLLTPIALDFGPVPVRSATGPHLFTLANLVPGSPGVSVLSVTTSGDFALAANTSGGATCSGVLVSTASCFVDVVFAPTAIGPRAGTLTITTDAGTATAALTGSGTIDPGLALVPTELRFTHSPGSASTQQSVVLANTGATVLSIGAVASSDAAFAASSNCTTLAPGSTCVIGVRFRAGFAPVTASLSIPVSSTVNGQNLLSTYTVALAGEYTVEDAGLQIVPEEINFGTAAVGAVGGTRLLTLNNLTAKTLAVTLSLPRQFPLAAPAACPMLNPYQSCAFAVTYTPAIAGAGTGTIFARGTPSDGSAMVEALGYVQGFGTSTRALTVTGNLVPQAPLNFGVPVSGQTSQQVLTLTNAGAGVVDVRRIDSEPPFYSATTCGAALAPGQACTVTVTYAPVAQVTAGRTSPLPRADAGTLTIESDASSSPDVIELAGSVTPLVTGSSSNGATLATFALSQSALTFPNTGVGNVSAPQTINLVNSGTVTLHVLGTLASSDFTVNSSCGTLLPGDTCTFAVSFRPGATSSLATRLGTLEIQTDASSALEFVSLLGSSAAAPLSLSPVALDFGTLNLGLSSRLGVAVTNNSATPVTFSGLAATGDYSAGSGTCPAAGSPLAPGATCTLQVSFTPTAVGLRSGTLSLSSSATPLPLTVALTGNGVVAKLQISPGALAFGPVTVGTPGSLSLSLQNAGSAPLTGISGQISGPNAAEFVITTQCSSATLAPGQGCSITVTFTPTAAGARSATLSIVSSDPSSPAIVPLTGIGSAPGSFTLTVNGGNTATATVKSGSPATYALSVAPTNGYTGAVALTCAPINPGPYASCSINPSTVTLNGGAQSSTVTINTITSASVEWTGRVTAFLALLGFPLLFATRSRKLRYALLPAILVCLAGCGGGVKSATSSSVKYTPSGTYQYQVTATSTSGPQITQSVTLNLIVQ